MDARDDLRCHCQKFRSRQGTVQLRTLSGERSIHFHLRRISVQAGVGLLQHHAHQIEICLQLSWRQVPSCSRRLSYGLDLRERNSWLSYYCCSRNKCKQNRKDDCRRIHCRRCGWYPCSQTTHPWTSSLSFLGNTSSRSILFKLCLIAAARISPEWTCVVPEGASRLFGEELTIASTQTCATRRWWSWDSPWMSGKPALTVVTRRGC